MQAPLSAATAAAARSMVHLLARRYILTVSPVHCQSPGRPVLRRVTQITALSPHVAAAAVAETPAKTPAADPDALKAYQRVQNGSDVRGIALDTNPDEPVTLTPAMMYFLGAAFAGKAAL